MFDNSKNFYTFVTDQNENIMTDYEKLIKEARTLEGLYFKGQKIIQTTLSTECKDSYCFLLCNIKDCNFYYSDVYSYNAMLKELDRFKSLCYKPLKVIYTNDTDRIDRVSAIGYLNIISNIDIKEANDTNIITPIEDIHEEIRRILNQKKDSKK